MLRVRESLMLARVCIPSSVREREREREREIGRERE